MTRKSSVNPWWILGLNSAGWVATESLKTTVAYRIRAGSPIRPQGQMHYATALGAGGVRLDSIRSRQPRVEVPRSGPSMPSVRVNIWSEVFFWFQLLKRSRAKIHLCRRCGAAIGLRTLTRTRGRCMDLRRSSNARVSATRRSVSEHGTWFDGCKVHQCFIANSGWRDASQLEQFQDTLQGGSAPPEIG